MFSVPFVRFLAVAIACLQAMAVTFPIALLVAIWISQDKRFFPGGDALRNASSKGVFWLAAFLAGIVTVIVHHRAGSFDFHLPG
jgi:hypothetical protein